MTSRKTLTSCGLGVGILCLVGACAGLDLSGLFSDNLANEVEPEFGIVSSTKKVFDFNAARVVEIQVNFESDKPVTFETRNCSASSDPVLHLFAPGGSSDERIELAVDDNSGGGVNARISVVPRPGSIAFLVPRAHQDWFGKCDVYRNGLPWRSNVDLGGKTLGIHGAHAGDIIETITRPNGFDVQAIYLLSGQSITQKIRPGTGTLSSASYTLPGTNAWFLVSGEGPTRVVVNDVATDTDGDGLGNQLEHALQTCSGASVYAGLFPCSRAKTSKDTDGDGLSDAWEVLGKRDETPHQPLSKWGADPRHKDLFLEMDFRADDQPEPVRMSPSTARQLAMYYADTIEQLPLQVQAHRAELLANPDGLPGFALHTDTGIPPERPQDATIYGSWGGYDILPNASKYETAWQDHMVAARRGVFHWGLGTRGGSGQAAGFGFGAAINAAETIAHELGHTLGLQHEGAASAGKLNCKPNYASPMNYAYNGVGFSDDDAPPFMNNQALVEYGTLADVPLRERYATLYELRFRYYVDRATWSVDFNRDGEIAPPGMTVRAFANNRPNGECEGTRERRGVLTQGRPTHTSPAVVRLGGFILLFSVTERGLELMYSGSSNYQSCKAAGGPDGSNPCGAFTQAYDLIRDPVRAVDAVRVTTDDGPIVVFTYVDGASTLRSGVVWRDTQGLKVGFDPIPLAENVSGEPSLSPDINATDALDYGSVAIEPLSAERAADAVRIEARDGNTESTPLDLPPGAPTKAAWLVIKSNDGTLLQSRYLAGRGWRAVQPALGPDGQPFKVYDAPGIVLGRMPGDSTDTLYLHAQHALNGSQDATLLRLDRGIAVTQKPRWVPTTFGTAPSYTRPGLAYVPHDLDANKGRVYAVYLNPMANAKDQRLLHMRMSTIELNTSTNPPTKTASFAFDAKFDNGWFFSHGVDLLFDPGIDTSLRAAIVYDFEEWNDTIVFHPFADGISDIDYGSFDDWSQMGRYACRSVVNPGGLVTNPMSCL